MKKALITGITGQDGSYLAELLLEKGLRSPRHHPPRQHLQHGAHRPSLRRPARQRRPALSALRRPRRFGELVKLLYELKPDEIYHLGAQSHVRVSFDIPEYTGDVTGLGHDPHPRGDPRGRGAGRAFTRPLSEMFGKVQEVPQTETTPFWPRSPTVWPRSTPTGRR